MQFGPITRRFVIFINLLILLGFAAGLVANYWATGKREASAMTRQLPANVLSRPKPITAFTLVDQHGQTFNLERLQGKWSFLFFGYTNCPDICPITMAMLRQFHGRLGQSPDLLKKTQFIFITVDPERDTPEQLKNYLGYFHKDFIGATGSPEQIKTFTRQLGILYTREAGKSEKDYLVAHSASILLTDPEGRLYGIFSPPHNPQEMAQVFLKITERT